MKPRKENKGIPEAPEASMEPQEKKTETFTADPKETTSIVCGNKILYLGTGLASITIEKA